MLIEEALQGSNTHRTSVGELVDSADRTVLLGDLCQFGNPPRFCHELPIALADQCPKRLSKKIDSTFWYRGVGDLADEIWVFETWEGAIEIKLRVRSGLRRGIEEHAKTTDRRSGSNRPSISAEMPITELRQHPIDPPFRWVEWNPRIIDSSDADVSGRMVENLLIVESAIGKRPPNRPEPLHQTF